MELLSNFIIAEINEYSNKNDYDASWYLHNFTRILNDKVKL